MWALEQLKLPDAEVYRAPPSVGELTNALIAAQTDVKPTDQLNIERAVGKMDADARLEKSRGRSPSLSMRRPACGALNDAYRSAARRRLCRTPKSHDVPCVFTASVFSDKHRCHRPRRDVCLTRSRHGSIPLALYPATNSKCWSSEVIASVGSLVISVSVNRTLAANCGATV